MNGQEFLSELDFDEMQMISDSMAKCQAKRNSKRRFKRRNYPRR